MSECKHKNIHGHKCRESVTKNDPEESFCKEHQRYAFVAKRKKETVRVFKTAEKYLDYETFKMSLIV